MTINLTAEQYNAYQTLMVLSSETRLAIAQNLISDEYCIVNKGAATQLHALFNNAMRETAESTRRSDAMLDDVIKNVDSLAKKYSA